MLSTTGLAILEIIPQIAEAKFLIENEV